MSSGLAVVNIVFEIESQQQDNWCWAATVMRKPAPCNVAWSFEIALNRTKNLASVTAKPMAVTAIQTELAGKRPSVPGGSGNPRVAISLVSKATTRSMAWIYWC